MSLSFDRSWSQTFDNQQKVGLNRCPISISFHQPKSKLKANKDKHFDKLLVELYCDNHGPPIFTFTREIINNYKNRSQSARCEGATVEVTFILGLRLELLLVSRTKK